MLVCQSRRCGAVYVLLDELRSGVLPCCHLQNQVRKRQAQLSTMTRQ